MTRSIEDALAPLLSAAAKPAAMADVAAWWAAHTAISAEVDADPVALALRAGFVAACPAFAFASGYQAALHALVPALPNDAIAALCVTEGPGGRPRDMKTTLSADRLDGRKTYVTLGVDAHLLLVAAVRGEVDGARPEVVLTRVSVPREGVTLSAKAPLPFVPELPHAQVDFAGGRVDDVLPGDGYDDYIKPFRTIEDLHVHLALGAFLLRTACQYGWPRPLVEELVALLSAGGALARSNPKSPLVHLALAAQLRAFRAFVTASAPQWDAVDANERTRWRRDQALLTIADTARTARTEAAWRSLAAAGPR